ncbi:MAG: YqiA/YcfP family alpha/beta fold hydrolase [Aquabacterium sp.]
MAPSTRTTHLLYLHGFRSSPQSFKARMMAAHIASLNASAQGGRQIAWACPQLPPSPAEAWALIRQTTQDWPVETMAVIGSSLGGFYATVLAERMGCRAAVINPAVLPARDLARYIGEQTSFHDPQEHFFFRPEFIGELEALAAHPITRPERYWALIAKGDEVLNWQEMVAHYMPHNPGVALTLLEDSDHAVSDFGQHMPGLLHWLGLDARAPR